MSNLARTAFLSFCAANALVWCGLAAAPGSAHARPATPAEQRYHPYDGVLPACDDAAVLSRIARTFRQRERAYWSSDLAIVGYERVAETAYRPNGVDYIPRCYCEAEAVMNDGRARRVVYHLGENLGVIGLGAGVEWCVVGLDRHNAWGRNCRAALP